MNFINLLKGKQNRAGSNQIPQKFLARSKNSLMMSTSNQENWQTKNIETNVFNSLQHSNINSLALNKNSLDRSLAAPTNLNATISNITNTNRHYDGQPQKASNHFIQNYGSVSSTLR